MLDDYDKDCMGERGGGHLVLEHIDMLGKKAVEDARIGG